LAGFIDALAESITYKRTTVFAVPYNIPNKRKIARGQAYK